MGILARLTRPDAGDPPTTEATDVAPAPSGDATRLRRRGLVAGAAALAATALATHPDPVAAAPLVGTANGYTGGTDTNLDGVQGYAVAASNAGRVRAQQQPQRRGCQWCSPKRHWRQWLER